MQKPSVSLILLRAEWFDSVVALPELVRTMVVDTQALSAELDKLFTIVGKWVINSAESLAKARISLREANVDLFILVFQVWAEDFYIVPLMEAIGKRPLAVWCMLAH